MKTLICGILVVLSSAYAFGQAKPGVYPWSITLKVVDDTNQQVANARAWVAYGSPKDGESIDPFHSTGWAVAGLTDTNGVFLASRTDRSWSLGIHVQKDSYYSSFLDYTLYVPGQFDDQKVTANRNPILTVILRQIGKPIAMYAKRQEMKIPKEDEPLGFDLMAGDWVTPYGKGFHADMFFTVHRKIISVREYDCTLTMTFPNKGDGIAVAPSEPDTGNEFKTSRSAAESGYQSELDLHYSNTNSPESVFGYFIRVRTILDDNGNVKSALYGKIPGNFRFYAGTRAPQAGMGFDYYLNPTPNDRNVEFDPRQNLLKGLKALEQVTEP